MDEVDFWINEIPLLFGSLSIQLFPLKMYA